MKKWFALLTMLVMVAGLLVGCGQSGDDADTVVAEVGKVKITKAEATAIYPMMAEQLAMVNEQYGIEVDRTARDFISSAKMTTLNVLVEGEALDQKLTALGGGFTDEEREAFVTQGQAEFDSVLASYVESYGLEEEAARAELAGMGYSVEMLAYSSFRMALEERLMPYTIEGMTIDEADARARYDELVAEAQTKYESAPSQFISDYLNNTAFYAVPEGVRLVKNLVIGLPEAQSAALTEQENLFYEKLYEQYMIFIEQSGKTDITEAETAAYNERIEALEAELDDITAAMERIQNEGREAVRAEAEAVLALAQAEGADFDALLAEYSIDQPTDRVKDLGYPVAAGVTTYVTSFTEGAMALETIGDISGLIASEYGFHILLYTGDLEAGPVAFEDVREAVEADLLATKQSEVYTETITKWIDEAKIKTYINRF